ncbi:MAG: selenocysteine-specific translation elongation factor [Anaerolineales bacterium]
MHVIGTAGHVDHGKSTLVEALTGIHPDRLREERAREMSIVLGFAWFTLPDGSQVSIVDVPGHRDFIENMLAGVGGIDAALLVVAADEGVMPQTREHLAILDLLGVSHGLVALTKTDLIHDSGWLDLVESDLRDVLRGTILADTPIVRVSARRRTGLDALAHTLQDVLSQCSPRRDVGRPRLPVDRVFSMPGFGTVVTGTLSDGALHIGDEVVILPGELRARVRGLQTHKQHTDIALSGSRTAVNLTGVRREQIARGDVVCLPDTYLASRRLTVHARLLADAAHPLRHNTTLKLFLGAAEALVRVRVLGQDVLSPGESGWLQLEPDSPLVAERGDRFILRLPSPSETIGGGTVLEVQAPHRYRRFDDVVLRRLQALTSGSPLDVLTQAVLQLEIADLSTLAQHSGMTSAEARQAVNLLLEQGLVCFLGEGENPWIASASVWQRISAHARALLETFHRHYPLRAGMPSEEFRSRLRLPDAWLAPVMRAFQTQGWLIESGPVVHLKDFVVRFSPQEENQVRTLLARFAQNPAAPPLWAECRQAVGDEVCNALLAQGVLVMVSPEIVFRAEDYHRLRQELIAYLQAHGEVRVAEMRDRWHTSRRYVLALLEHFDTIGLTRRVDDIRVLHERRG